MNYKTSEIAKLSGVSSRTLRYYDEINLLKPNEILQNGYRVYTENEVNKLQLILFYRAMNISLEEIKVLISSNGFNRTAALENHLINLIQKKCELEKIIHNLSKTIKYEKEGIKMLNSEKFVGLEAIAENENKYKEELKGKYGEKIVDESFKKIRKSSPENIQKDIEILNQSLVAAFKTGDPTSKEAVLACENHKKLLLDTWAEGTYSKKSHYDLVKGFTEDERFTKYYEAIQEGLMDFFYQAIKIYCK